MYGGARAKPTIAHDAVVRMLAIKSHQPFGLGWFSVEFLFSPLLFQPILVSTLWGRVYPSPYHAAKTAPLAWKIFCVSRRVLWKSLSIRLRVFYNVLDVLPNLFLEVLVGFLLPKQSQLGQT